MMITVRLQCLPTHLTSKAIYIIQNTRDMGWGGCTYTVSDGVGWRYALSVGWGGVEVRTQCRMGWGEGTHAVSDGVEWRYAHSVG